MEVVSRSCHEAMPIDNVFIICAAIVLCLLIIAVATCVCFLKAQNVKVKEIEKRLKAEKEKLESEQNYKRYKDQYDSAWRTYQYAIKKELPENCEDTGKEAEKYIKCFWEQKISEVDKDSQS